MADPPLSTPDPAELAKGELLTLLSHELRGPLGAIAAAADVLGIVPANSETAAEARDVIARQARILAHLLDDLRTRPLAGPAVLSTPQPLDADALPLSRRRQVLVIDADADRLESLRRQLVRDGHQVSATTDAAQGLERLLELRPQVSIVGIALAGMTGQDLARRARAAGYTGRMIALAGAAASGTLPNELRVAGFDAWLPGPVDRAQLRACLGED